MNLIYLDKVVIPAVQLDRNDAIFDLHTEVKSDEDDINLSIPDGIDIHVRVRKVEDDLLTDIHIKGWGFFLCDRCCEPFKREIKGRIQTVFTRDRSKIEEDNDDYQYWDGSEKGIDITQDVLDVILLSIPVKMLCSESCKGLCDHCGQNLNESTCRCEQETHDPRWDALKNIKFD